MLSLRCRFNNLDSNKGCKSVTDKRRYSTAIRPKSSVVISGAGPAGLACALTLQQHGIQPVVIDSALNVSHFAGQGLILPYNAMNILKKLHLERQVQENGQILSKYLYSDFKGNAISLLNFEELGQSLNSSVVSIDKSILISVLGHQLTKSIRWKEQIQKLGPATDSNGKITGVRCTFKDLNLNGDYDLVIGADGINSRVRDLAFDQRGINTKKATMNWIIYSAFVDRPALVDEYTSVELWGRGSRLFLVPVGNNKLYVWGTVNSYKMPTSGFIQGERKGSDQFLSNFLEWQGWGVQQAKDQIEKTGKCNLSIPVDLEAGSQWSTMDGRIILAGDAAHGMPPNTPQGAAMAIEDGYVLGKCIAYSDSVEQAAKAYYSSRSSQIKHLRKISTPLGLSGQLNSHPFRMIARDLALRWRVSERSLKSHYTNFFKYTERLDALFPASEAQ